MKHTASGPMRGYPASVSAVGTAVITVPVTAQAASILSESGSVPRGKLGIRSHATRAGVLVSGRKNTSKKIVASAVICSQKVSGGSMAPKISIAIMVAMPPAAKPLALASVVTCAARRPASGPAANSAAQAVAPPASRPTASPCMPRAKASVASPGAVISAMVPQMVSASAARTQGLRPIRSDRPPNRGADMIALAA